MKFSKRVLIASTALLMFVAVVRPVVFAAQPDYSTIRMKFFHLLNLVGGEEASSSSSTSGSSSPTSPSGPAAPPLATPTPAVKNTIIAYKGKQIGTAKYDPVTKYQMNIEIPEFFDTTVDYYGWVKKTNPDAIVRLASDPLPGFTNLSIVNTQDLTDYTEFVISEEKKGLQHQRLHQILSIQVPKLLLFPQQVRHQHQLRPRQLHQRAARDQPQEHRYQLVRVRQFLIR